MPLGNGVKLAALVAGPTHVDVTEGGKKLRRGARLWTIAVSRRARNARRTTCTCRAHEAEWIKQLVAEQLVTVKTKRGFSRLEWQKLSERNEALDCRVYARAAAWIAGADRWTEAMWRDLEQQIGMAPEVATEMVSEAIEAVAGVIRRTPARRDRRVFRSSYMS